MDNKKQEKLISSKFQILHQDIKKIVVNAFPTLLVRISENRH